MIGTSGDGRRVVGLLVERVGFDASDSIVPIAARRSGYSEPG
ncbi:hypothetical protein PC116_g5499 [Phytophthora cactorum]|uniref:Uncharacterized protein n=1 Tax=Phytophthora cactorum TaxID=29920 RepID=A0A8T1E0I1_9STRA|nr:hypothetical protein Pcac1_g21380 [Phytophthora cactorum]KAG2911934.1 hypothetical protein PC114_g9148 [Phytophthora cactorum]KAG2945580.1 hypothetical protein PC117_g8340 [Phytophthora cactorum]KAG3016368.1 hypothetical protein PC120_g11667 [Phytophthora cactorum]KAG3027124.1 hypothetical protein PC119_g7512 [Phytophthora cactorum]